MNIPNKFFDFNDNQLDKSFWVVPDTYNNKSGVQVKDGILKMEQTVTDDHNIHIRTKDIAFEKQIIIERDVFLHKANENYTPKMEYTFDNGYIIQIIYRNDSWSNIYGFCLSFVKDGKLVKKEINMKPLILDKWFKEKIIINRDGTVKYYIDGNLIKEESIGNLINTASSYRLLLDTYGWWTGHKHYFDNFKMINNK